ncbi:MAG: TadE/TadG family type IV pilus assembly protein [Actinomycetes bacterium]
MTAPPRPRARPGRRPGARPGVRERGSMAVETVLLAPVFLLFLLFLVGAGRVVEAQGEVNGAARDAARAASVRRTFAEAQAAAREAAEAVLGRDCAPRVELDDARWRPGGAAVATVTCELDLGFLGFGAVRELTGRSVVPIERLRRVE